jgi:hypothetical protein
MVTFAAPELTRSTDRLIERFMPHADVRERYEVLVRAPADLVFDVAWNFDLQAIPVVRAIFRLREMFLGAKTPSERRSTGLVAETTALGWGVLAHRPGRELVMGAVTQPWRGDVTFTAVAPEYFTEFADPNLVKIVWTIEVEPLGPAVTRFRHETRVLATDDVARRKFLRYWWWARIGIRMIRRLMIPAVQREAERQARKSPTP